MDQFLIHGGRPLLGDVDVSGSKNASLPILAACLMADGPTTLHGVPRLSDITSMVALLRELRLPRHPTRAAQPGRHRQPRLRRPARA